MSLYVLAAGIAVLAASQVYVVISDAPPSRLRRDAYGFVLVAVAALVSLGASDTAFGGTAVQTTVAGVSLVAASGVTQRLIDSSDDTIRRRRMQMHRWQTEALIVWALRVIGVAVVVVGLVRAAT